MSTIIKKYKKLKSRLYLIRLKIDQNNDYYTSLLSIKNDILSDIHKAHNNLYEISSVNNTSAIINANKSLFNFTMNDLASKLRICKMELYNSLELKRSLKKTSKDLKTRISLLGQK